MKKKTKIAQISILVITLLLTAFPVRADDLAAPVPAPADFWVRDQPGRITHACGGKEPLVLCMQGRKVVMQVQSDRTNGFSYTARFFNLQKEVEKKQALFVAGRESTPEVRVNDQPWKSEFPSSVTFDGMLTLTYPEAGGVVVTRTVYPSMTKALVIEEWQVRNTTGKQVVVTVPPARTVKPVGEDIAIVWSCPGVKTAEVKAGGVLSFSTCVQAGLAAEPDLAVNVAAERGARLALAEAAWRGPGRLETPEPLLDHAFALQKLHVLECPIETIKGVITHNGSLTYSPGIWANDPVEYSSPLFPFFGDAELNKASMNMYRVWLDYCREHGGDAIPGCFWQPTLQVGQWERGDDAMMLYGLSKFLLFQGDRAAAEEMWPLIEMCAASVLKHTTADGIVASESDEMEGRYPTGNANLSTSSLAYGGYRLAARLAQSLGKPAAAEFDRRAEALRKAIESYFGAEVEGFKTYRYYKGNTTLRGWILAAAGDGHYRKAGGHRGRADVRQALAPPAGGRRYPGGVHPSNRMGSRDLLRPAGVVQSRPNRGGDSTLPGAWSRLRSSGPRGRIRMKMPLTCSARARSIRACSPRACSASCPPVLTPLNARRGCPRPGRGWRCGTCGPSASLGIWWWSAPAISRKSRCSVAARR